MSGKYPEHDRLSALNGKNQAVGDFIHWLGRRGFVICRSKTMEPAMIPVNEWISEFFGLDEAALSREKEAMFDEMRKAQAPQ